MNRDGLAAGTTMVSGDGDGDGAGSTQAWATQMRAPLQSVSLQQPPAQAAVATTGALLTGGRRVAQLPAKTATAMKRERVKIRERCQ